MANLVKMWFFQKSLACHYFHHCIVCVEGKEFSNIWKVKQLNQRHSRLGATSPWMVDQRLEWGFSILAYWCSTIPFMSVVEQFYCGPASHEVSVHSYSLEPRWCELIEMKCWRPSQPLFIFLGYRRCLAQQQGKFDLRIFFANSIMEINWAKILGIYRAIMVSTSYECRKNKNIIIESNLENAA